MVYRLDKDLPAASGRAARQRRIERTVTPEHPYLVDFLEYWRAKCGDRAMPARADIDPLDIPRILPYVYLVDVLDDPPDFAYRLLGTDVVANTKIDYTGRKLSELEAEGTQGRLAEIYRRVRDAGLPSVDRIRYESRSGNVKIYENVLAPVSEDGRRVSMLFGAAVHLRNSAAGIPGGSDQAP